MGGARGGVRPSLGGAGGAVHKTRLQGRARRGEDGYGQAFRPGHGAMAGPGSPLGGREEREKAQGTLWGGAAPEMWSQGDTTARNGGD